MLLDSNERDRRLQALVDYEGDSDDEEGEPKKDDDEHDEHDARGDDADGDAAAATPTKRPKLT